MIREPAELMLKRLPLEGMTVGISGAVPERKFWGQVPDLDRLILTFVAQLSALVIRYGGVVVHGSQPVLTPVVAEQARRQAREGTTPLKLFASQLYGEIPDVTLRAARSVRAEVIVTSKIGNGDARDPETRNQSLTAMRLAMTQQADVVVAVGGKLHVDTGFNPGVLEELMQARWSGARCFVIGAFGGVAGQLERPVIEELCAGNFLEVSELTVMQMANWDEAMDEYVGKLLGHLARNAQEFRKPERFHYNPATFRPIHRSDTASLLSVEPGMVKAWSNRFARLLHALETRDTSQACEILRSDSV
jgi:hypothetical protein